MNIIDDIIKAKEKEFNFLWADICDVYPVSLNITPNNLNEEHGGAFGDFNNYDSFGDFHNHKEWGKK